MKKKMIVLIAFIYIASMLFCGDGVGKKFVEEKFPHLTYSDKECNDSKKKELRIVEDEDTAGGILSYEELAAMENENASVRNNMLPDTDQLAFVDEAEKNGELAELKEQQNVKMPQVDMSFDNLVKNYYQVDKTTYIGADELCEEALLGRDMSIEKSGDGPDILIYHTHSQEGYSDSLDTSETETVVGVGDRLESLLREKYGYNVLHHKGQYDVNDRDHAYSNSLPEITEIIEKNPSIKVVIDLHRDGVAETTRLAATIDGKPMAQIMFFNGPMERAYRDGMVRAIGLSNFYDARFVDLVENVEVKPSVLQLETHVFSQQKRMRELINEYGMHLMAWGPLAQGSDRLFTDETLKAIGTKYGKTNAQVALKFLTSEGIVAIPKSIHKDRMASNFDIADFELTEEDKETIRRMDTGKLKVDFNDPDMARYLLEYDRKFNPNS